MEELEKKYVNKDWKKKVRREENFFQGRKETKQKQGKVEESRS